MAIYEYEAEPRPETEQAPLDYFKDGLHGMVMDMEANGGLALSSLLIVRAELKAKSIDLMRQSNDVEHNIRSGADSYSPELIEELGRLQEEHILVYHEQIWTEGYIRDRQKKV
jgi:hypothetical protein